MEVQFRNPGILYTEIITEAVEIFSPQSGFVQPANQAEFATRRALCNFEVDLSVANRLIGRPLARQAKLGASYRVKVPVG